MKKIKFTHLRLITEYSFNKGLIKIEEIIKELKSNKQKSIVIADDNLHGLTDFYTSCLKNKIKPIIGCNFFLKNKKNINKPYKIFLLIKNQEGYRNILKIINKSNLLKNNEKYCEVDKNWFKGNLNKGLILISSGIDGDIGQYLINNDKKKAKICTLFWSKYFKNRFYIEIHRSCKYYNYYNKKVTKLSLLLNLPLVAINEILFIKKKDFKLYKIKYCILNNNNLNNLDKNILKYKYNFFIKRKRIKNLFKNNITALLNSWYISKRCNLILDLDKIEFPVFINKINNNKIIIKLGLYFLKFKIKNNNINYKNKNIYKKRILKECKVIINMGLSDYYLIVRDFINWSKKKKIPVGPGRGSSSGSLISYVFNITDIDPVKNNLVFERFLNIKRLSMPDFDIDFCPIKRFKVINYIKKKYGISFISQIATFGKIASKASIRDIGRALNINYLFVDKLVKLIPFKQSNNNIKEILKLNYNLNFRYKNEIEVKKIINLAIKLEGSNKNIGIHAGGLLISNNKINENFPLFCQNSNIVTQYCKNSIEKLGLLKFDFLGLKTLSIIYSCIKSISKNFKKKIILINLPLNNKFCFLNLKLGKTLGIFQLESEGMQSMLIKAKPDSFKNIIALTALYRPGPISLISSFCARKLGNEKIIYFDKKLKNILEETYGIIIYQEQIIFIVKIISNFSLENSDLLRIAISKKNSSEMYKQKTNFIENGIKNGFSEKFLKNIFNKIEKFSKYGFNKSHATAYSLISYYTLWLKCYYFSEFISSNLSYYFNNANKIKFLIKESKDNNLYIIPLNINKSFYNFISYKNFKINKIRYGFSSIKGLGKSVIKNLIKIRKIKPFKSFLDFYLRINKNIINKKIIETLICCGAFDSIDINRFNLLNKYKIILNKKFKSKSRDIYFWKFKTKSLLEKDKLGFFFINNLYNIYYNRINFIINKKKYLFKNTTIVYGILSELHVFNMFKEKIYYLTIINNENFLRITIRENLYKKNLINFKLFKFLLFFCYLKKKKFFKSYKIYNKKILFL